MQYLGFRYGGTFWPYKATLRDLAKAHHLTTSKVLRICVIWALSDPKRVKSLEEWLLDVSRSQ